MSYWKTINPALSKTVITSSNFKLTYSKYEMNCKKFIKIEKDGIISLCVLPSDIREIEYTKTEYPKNSHFGDKIGCTQKLTYGSGVGESGATMILKGDKGEVCEELLKFTEYLSKGTKLRKHTRTSENEFYIGYHI